MKPEHAPILAAFTLAGVVWGYFTHVLVVKGREIDAKRRKVEYQRRQRMIEAAHRERVRQVLDRNNPGGRNA
jgi:hypothetical protein